MAALPVALRRRARILIYGRYSTTEQDVSSIQDQFSFCEAVIQQLGFTDFEIIKIFDMELSGELASRPGIDKVREGIEQRRWDLLICEDSSRLFRHPAACLSLVNSAVDKGVRVLCYNDQVDTHVDGWDDRLLDATRHHAKANAFTRQRIKRKQEGLWRLGAAMGLLRPGYERRASKPPTDRDRAKGPFFDSIDPKWAPVIQRAFEMGGNGDPAWLIAGYLTDQGLPKCSNAKSAVWTDRGAIALLRRTIYRGFETFRDRVAKKQRVVRRPSW